MPYADPAKNAECKKRYHDRKRAERGLPPSQPRPVPMTAEEVRVKRAEYRERNKEEIAAYQAKWAAANPEIIERYRASEARKAALRRYEDRNREKVRASKARWRAENPDKVREMARLHAKKPMVRLKSRIHDGVRRGLRSGRLGARTAELLDFSLEELRVHLERQFLRGMSWENMGDWHIDHIVPLSSFKIETPGDAEFKRAWALTNLRPLWAADNLRKWATRVTLL